VTAVLFVAAISEYDQMLYEDENTNRIVEALNLFEEICNSRWFRETSMILFLNKRDLFQDKVRPLSDRIPARPPLPRLCVCVRVRACVQTATAACEHGRGSSVVRGCLCAKFSILSSLPCPCFFLLLPL
jgi:hypothetical protein